MCMFCARAIGESDVDPVPSEEEPIGVTAATLALPEEDAAFDSPVENGSGGTIAGVAASGDQRTDGLLIGVRWAGAITYSDPDSAADYQANHPENFTNFQQISAAQLADRARGAERHDLDPAGRRLQLLGRGLHQPRDHLCRHRHRRRHDPARQHQRSRAPLTPIIRATRSAGGDAFFGGAGRFPTAGNYDWLTIIHELGHSLGLKHGHETDVFGAVPAACDSMEFSVMSYRAYVGAPLTGPFTNEAWGFAQTYMMLDIAALQHMYGADFTHNGGNTTYSWNPTNGESYVNGNLAIDPGGNRIFSTIWDGNGTDTYDLSNYSTNLRLDLELGRPLGPSPRAQLADLDIGRTAATRGATSSTRCSSTATPAR